MDALELLKQDHKTVKELLRTAVEQAEQFYKGYRIEVSVTLDGDSWFAALFIYYSLRNILVTFPVNEEFKTYDDAMEAGLAAAKKWIDERMSNPKALTLFLTIFNLFA
jgi:hypothetical protein